MTYLRKGIGALTAAAGFLAAGVASAQTTTTTTPGVPSTGAGGDPAMVLIVLGIAALAVIVGGAYLLWPSRSM
jgi:hypothetical protein